MNDWIQKAVRSRADYGQVIALNNGDSIASSGALGFASASSDNIRFTPGTTENASYSLGHLGNISGSTAAFQVSRTLPLQGGGNTTITVAFAGSPSAFDAGSIDVAIANAGLATDTSITALGLATQTDVISARNVILGSV